MAQWWPLPAQNDEDSRSLVRSFLDVFPYATAWSTELHEVLLVGSSSPIELDGARIAGRYSQPEVRSVLAEVGIESPEALLATWVTDRAGLERFAGDAPPVTDDRPLIEHAAWVRRGEIQRVLPRLLALATDVPLPACRPTAPGGRGRAPRAARLLPLLPPRSRRRARRGRGRSSRSPGPRPAEPVLPLGGVRKAVSGVSEPRSPGG